MRVVAGKYRGRHFLVPPSFKARPTTDFAKENLFNVLRGYIDFTQEPTALDLFAGTGSITLELLSRGCRRVVSVEKDPRHFQLITSFLDKLGDNCCYPVRADVFRLLPTLHEQFDLVFADPPYTLPGLHSLPDIIRQHQLLTPQGILALEHGKADDFRANPSLVDTRQYGSVHFSLFRFPKDTA
ncbi:MAG: RsmD family RNA methyltransferase [Prevotellaceae bacterium]|nr:RsmD family RNA methyltransferase [Prevotellaceae bacterium]